MWWSRNALLKKCCHRMEFGFAHLCTVKPILLTPGYGEESADVE